MGHDLVSERFCTDGIPGWMNAAELAWLEAQAANHENIVEVGSWMGRSTKALCRSCPGTVYAVDLWQEAILSDEQIRQFGLFTSEPDWIYAAFCRNFKDEIASKKCILVREESVAAAKGFVRCNPVDMVFIDADHSYESVTRDILAWRGVSRKLFCGHDYDRDTPGVIRAVDELLPKRKVISGGTIWYVEAA